MAGQQVARTQRLSAGWPMTAAIVSLATALLIGSVLSYHNDVASTSNEQARSYYATAQAALNAAPAGAVIWDQQAPALRDRRLLRACHE